MEKKLTPMMQLREKLQRALNDKYNNGKHWEGYSLALKNIISNIETNILLIEREMIEDTFKDAQVLHQINNQMRAEQYYTETFKTE